MPSSFFDNIAPVLPVVGSLGAAAIQRNWALKDLAAQNKYNSPAEQIKRLKEAKLPLATMFGGQGGSTSEQPRGTDIDPSLGVGKGLDAYYMNRMQKKQMELLDQNIRKATYDADISQVERNWKVEEAPDFQLPGVRTPNQAQVLEIGKQKANIDRLFTENQKDWNVAKYEVYNSLRERGIITDEAKAKLDLLLNQVKEVDQRLRNNEIFLTFKQKFFDAIKNSPSGITDLKAFVYMALASVFNGMK